MKQRIAILLLSLILLMGCDSNTAQSEVRFAAPAAATNTTTEAVPTEEPAQPAETAPAEEPAQPVETAPTEVPTQPAETEPEEVPTQPSQTAPLFPDMEAEVLRLMNEQRDLAGVAPLTMDYSYYDCAVTRAYECLEKWSHTRPDGRRSYSVYEDFGMLDGIKLAGENLAKNFSSPESIVKMLMDSPGHRQNILHREYDRVVISIVRVEGWDGLYAMSQLFIAKEEGCR